MTPLQVNHREKLLSLLSLLASREEQLRYQQQVPFVPVTVELFCQWDACYGPRNHAWFLGTFTAPEVEALDSHEAVMKSIRSELQSELNRWLPLIEDFIMTPQWKQLALSAANTLQVLENHR